MKSTSKYEHFGDVNTSLCEHNVLVLFCLNVLLKKQQDLHTSLQELLLFPMCSHLTGVTIVNTICVLSNNILYLRILQNLKTS